MKHTNDIAKAFVRKLTVALFLLVPITNCTNKVRAQVARLYTNEHGLKTNNCNSIDIDSRGLVWVSGYNSLGLFDGMKFQYIPIKSEDGRLLFQNVYGVKEHKDDKFWVATSHGFYLLNARDMKFDRIFLQENEDTIYGYATNTVIDYPKEDHILITTDGFKSFLLNTKTLKVDQSLSDRLNYVLEDGFVNHPTIDKNHNLWVTTNSTPLMCIDLNTIKPKALDYTPAAKATINSSTITQFLQTKDGILIGTSKGLLKYNYAQNLVQEIDMPNNNLHVSSLIRTRDERILVGTNGRGIWELLKKNGSMTLHPLYQQTIGIDISYGKIMDMTEDNNGNIIAAFLQKGIVVVPPQNDCFHYHPISPLANGQNATCVTAMTIDKDKNYWVATDGCGVFTTNGMKLATAHPVNQGLRSMLTQDILIDKHGTVWTGSYGGGVQYYEDGKWTSPWLSMLSKERVMSLHYDKDNDQILVGTNGNGIFIIDIAKKSVFKYELPFQYNQWISCINLGTDKTLWIATSSGVFYYNKSTDKRGEITLDGNRISNACDVQQSGDNILIAFDEGLLIHNTKTGEQTLINEEKGLSCQTIRAITTTEKHIWLATRTNIASVDKETLNVKNFSSFSGYVVGEFHRSSSLKPGDGYILFGGDNGIICFTPSLINNRNTKIEHVYFTNLTTPLHTEKLDADIFYATSVDLSNDNSSFTIDFSVAELGDPERIHYDYILEGHESQWHTDAPQNSANYSSLPSGSYTFRVKAYMEDNPTESMEKSIKINVAAPWYATTWAFIIYILLTLSLAYYIYKQSQIRKRQHEMLRKSSENNRIKEAKLKLFTSIAHELRSPLTMIESPLKQLINDDKDQQHQSLYAIMQRNCDRLLGIVKQITDIRKIDSGQFKLKLEEQDYVKYSDQIFEQFKGVATVKEISFIVEHNEEELPLMIDTTHFEKIITNLLSNAFKFTPNGGKVIVRSGIVGSKAELRFYNSGSRFNEEDLSHLWERFYQGSAGNDSSGSGIGLNLVHELVKLHHGTIEAKNIEPNGVEFTLHFPCYNTHIPTLAEGNKRTILLVDDDTELTEYMATVLSRDHNIITACSGNSGWKKVLASRPDVVITDYRMPDGNGMELCQLIKSNPETDSTPVIMLTGEGDETLQLHSLNIQVDHYLEKPVNVTMLRSAINQVLRVRENLRTKVKRTEMGNDMPKPVLENPEEKLYGKIIDSIKRHLDDSNYSVQQLSEEVGISRVHLNRKMKERYGVSPNTFIKSFRLKQAAYLFVNNNANVSEVAYLVGFSSHSYFTTSFHDYFGMSPKEFIAYYSEEQNSEALQKLLE